VSILGAQFLDLVALAFERGSRTSKVLGNKIIALVVETQKINTKQKSNDSRNVNKVEFVDVREGE
jgi:hypothetical protein